MGPCWKCAQALDQSKLAVRRLGMEGHRSLWVMESGNGALPVDGGYAPVRKTAASIRLDCPCA